MIKTINNKLKITRAELIDAVSECPKLNYPEIPEDASVCIVSCVQGEPTDYSIMDGQNLLEFEWETKVGINEVE